MAFPDRKYFQRIADSSGFQVDVLEKVYRLSLLLNKIAPHPTFGKMLVLRGGTALNFLYLDLPRLSIDLDLDFVGAIEKEEMQEIRLHLNEGLKRIFKAGGYEIVKREKYALDQHFLHYTNTIPQKDLIKVEINFLNRVPVLGTRETDFTTPLFDQELCFNVLTLQLEELIASKTVALLSRTHSRDFYDVFRLSDFKPECDLVLSNKLVILLGSVEEEGFLDATPEVVENITYYDLKTQGLITLLRKDERIDLDRMKRVTKPFLATLLKRDEVALNFLKKFYEGDFDPHLILRDYSINPRLAKHPGARWRLQNLTSKQKQEALSKLV